LLGGRFAAQHPRAIGHAGRLLDHFIAGAGRDVEPSGQIAGRG
jgi:hypothetical protein